MGDDQLLMGFDKLIPAPTEHPLADKPMDAVWHQWFYQMWHELVTAENFTLPQSEINRIIKIINGTGPTPPPPPPAGSCAGTTFNTTLPWSSVGRIDGPAGFDVNTNWVFQITTPASGNWVGGFQAYETSGGGDNHHLWIASSPCGTPLPGASSDQTALEPTIHFFTGSKVDPTMTKLDFNKTYYFTLRYVAAVGPVGTTAVQLNLGGY